MLAMARADCVARGSDSIGVGHSDCTVTVVMMTVRMDLGALGRGNAIGVRHRERRPQWRNGHGGGEQNSHQSAAKSHRISPIDVR